MSSSRRFVLVLSLILGCVLGYALDTHACGMFVPNLKAKAVPRLERERVLIVWDKASHREHFVREVRFNNGDDQSFGFVIPVPNRPEVHDVKSSPFDALESRFGHTLLETANASDGFGKGGPPGAGASRGVGGAAPVRVVEKKRVGDFTSFTLEASDAGALAGWLKKNQFRITPEGQKWASHYVELGYFFVALRFDGKKRKPGEPDALVSRTLRISFDSALPFYPYVEPADVPEQSGRELAVWLVSDALLLPLAGMDTGSGWELRRPWSEGARHEPAQVDLTVALGPDLSSLPARDARVQTFGDWKEHRRGFGDVVLVPAQPEACDASCVRARRPLVALLDPSLRTFNSVSDNDLAVPAPAPRRPGSSWVVHPTRRDDGRDWIVGALFCALFAARALRRRAPRQAALALVGLAIGCGQSPPTPATPSTTPSGAPAAAGSGSLVIAEGGDEPPLAKIEPFALPSDPAARQKTVIGVLAGHHGERFIPTWSTPFARGIGHARNSFLSGVVDLDPLARRCIQDDRVEAIVSFSLERAPNGGIQRAHVEGPLPPAVLGCIESRLRSEIRSPGVASTGWLSFGVISPEANALRERISAGGFTTVANGPVSVRDTALTVSGGVNKEGVRGLLRNRFGLFRSCYEQSVHPATKGSVTLRFSIAPSGQVTKMAATTADVATPTGVCLGNTVRSLVFPPTPNGQTVNVVTTIAFDRSGAP